jgi:purine-binding chemotaxis protein CheW
MHKTQEKIGSEEMHVVSFELYEREYAVDLAKVVEIIYFEGVIPVPKAPVFIKGIIDLRGAVVPVLDLKEKLGLASSQTAGPDDPIGRPDHILIVKVRNRRLGILVDRVRGVVPIETDKIQPPHEIVRKHSEFLTGVCKARGRLILLLDIEALLSPEEKDHLSEVHAHR